MDNLEITYLQGADGQFYAEMPNGDLVKAEPGLSFLPLPNGRFIAVRDTEEARRQAQGTSHERYYNSLAEAQDEREIRQNLKRQKALERRLNTAAMDRVLPGPMAGVQIITDKEFERLHAEYTAAAKEGRGHECDFQPLATYQHKVTRARPVFQGEVGVLKNGTILRLQEGFSINNTITVPEDIK